MSLRPSLCCALAISVGLQVIEVGVTDVRYVAIEHSRPWVIHAYRNIKGRGLHKEEELESETVPIQSTTSTVTSTVDDNNSHKASSDDVITLEGTLSSDKDEIGGLTSEQRRIYSRKRKYEDDELIVDTSKSIDDASEDKRFKADTCVEEKQVQNTGDESISNDGKQGNVDDELSVDTETSVDDASEVKKFKGDTCVEEKQIQNTGDESTSDAGKLDSGLEDTSDSGKLDSGLVETCKSGKLDLGSVETVESIAEQPVDTGTVGNDCENGDKRTRSIRKRKSTDQETQTTTKAPPPTSTYDKVRLIIQPWRKPEGGINKPILKMMLESVMLFLMMKPGSTEGTLQDRYLPYLQPMVLQTVVKILEEIGCLKKTYIKKVKCSLFSKPVLPEIRSVGTEHYDAMFFPTEECLFRLGQFGREFYPNVKWPSTTT